MPVQAVQELKSRYFEYLHQHPFTKEPVNLYEPVDYIMLLGGKRLRPVLALMAYNLYHDQVAPALPIAHAVELFHNFSLVHDDIMDQAPLRRGQPTVHKKYDTNTAILSGDVMLVAAYQSLLQVANQEVVPELIRIFSLVAEGVCVGQQYDMDFETRDTVTIVEYMNMIEHKTALLLSGALQLGATLAGASQSDIHHLDQFGRKVGIAFQIQDDLLDTFGDPLTFGKKVGGDIIQNKKTWLVLKTRQLASTTDQQYLADLLNNSRLNEQKKIEQVKQIFTKYNIPELASHIKNQYQQEATEHLGAVNVEQKRKDVLKQLTTDLLGRKE